MEHESPLDREFRALVADCELDGTSTEERILSASEDMRLVLAVYDVLAASFGPFLQFNTQEEREAYEKQHDDAQGQLTEVTINLQYSYNLDDAEMRQAVSLARTTIEKNKLQFD